MGDGPGVGEGTAVGVAVGLGVGVGLGVMVTVGVCVGRGVAVGGATVGVGVGLGGEAAHAAAVTSHTATRTQRVSVFMSVWRVNGQVLPGRGARRAPGLRAPGARRPDQGLEQAQLLRVRVDHRLGVELHAHAERVVGRLHPLDHAV